MEIGLQQAQTLKQILSPQMIQSMEILQMNAQQLEERIEEALEENVALEREETESDGAGADEGSAAEGESAPGGGAEAESSSGFEDDRGPSETDLLAERYDQLASFQAEQYYTSPSGRGGGEEDDKLEALQNTAGRPPSLQDHLVEQIRLRTGLDERHKELCLQIIFSLDERGYLLYSLEAIHESLNETRAEQGSREDSEEELSLPVSWEELEAAHAEVRRLDPPGVGARDLQDCLLLQLERDPGDYPLETVLIQNHLKDIAKNRLPQIAKATGHALEEVKEAVEIITTLNPNPGRAFSFGSNAVVRPDVLIEEVEGELRVSVTNSYLPRLRISPYYRELLERSKRDPEVRKYIKKRIDNAEWLLQAIHQRSSTLQRVAEEVVKHQEAFFRKGERFLKPLKMQEIATIIDVNVSTVSRAIAGKYFQAPSCIRDLKFLFTGGTTRDDGSMESRGAVILRIKDLIAKEDKKKPLSDSKIVDLLAKDGIKISRRTVTKYREAESIASSRERRDY